MFMGHGLLQVQLYEKGVLMSPWLTTEGSDSATSRRLQAPFLRARHGHDLVLVAQATPQQYHCHTRR
jgi:hypothetical protein